VEPLDQARPDTFVIHVATNAAGELAGVVHYVRTREKRRFEGMEELSAAIRGMGRRAAPDTEE
jgi:hypothetical protein